jgi:hypothetical protein
MMSGDPEGFEVLSGCQATESAPRKSGSGATGTTEMALLSHTGLLFGKRLNVGDLKAGLSRVRGVAFLNLHKKDQQWPS